MVVLQKNELDFLSIFNSSVSTVDSKSDKVNMIVKDGKLYFTQYSGDITLLYRKEGQFPDINVWYETAFLFNFVKSIATNTDITFSEDEGIKINSKSFYKPKTYEYDNENLDFILELVDDPAYKEYDVKQLEAIGKAKNFIGNSLSKEFDAVRIDNGKFMAVHSDETISVIVKTDNGNIEQTFFIEKAVYNILKGLGIDEIKIKHLEDKGYFLISLGDLSIFYPEKSYDVPDLDSEDIKGLYYHPTKVVFNKDDFKEVLNRIFLVTSKDYKNRIFFTVFEDHVEIESRDGGLSGKEKISAVVDSDAVGKVFILSAVYIQQTIQSLEGDSFMVRVDTNDDPTAVSFMTEKEDVIFIHCLFPDIPSE